MVAFTNAEELQESQILIDLLEQFYPGIKADIRPPAKVLSDR